ncbi:nitroreductase family protein [uncultured Bradyrhizobium sp.]|jgi:nitroreductase|uniref:nitroreductase family protein n=1 Tax=uncultured Bradyrhizobium sp. TaxID=199684 RepID=UPI00261BCCB4|nr:nitroreductase family protein [uncultured Bradyrhizobium sp.]
MNCIATIAAEPATSAIAEIFPQPKTGGNTPGSQPSHSPAQPVPTNVVIETILSRSAAKYYDPTATLRDDQIRELVRIGTSAPTSFHLQNWRFIAVRTPEAKARLHPIAWKQPAILDAAVTFIIIGQLADASTVPDRLASVVEAGIMPAHLVPDWEIPARGLYDDQPQRQRDEAVRSATFGAAAIIYAARSLGWGSTPMIGFDAEAVHREFGLAGDEVPVMLLTVGPERAGNWPQKPRMPVADVLDFA